MIYEQICDEVDQAVVSALKGKYTLDLYKLLEIYNSNRSMAEAIIDSPTAARVNLIVFDLEDYISGTNKELKKSYGHLTRTQAKETKEYLYSLLEGAWRFAHEKRRRRKRSTKQTK